VVDIGSEDCFKKIKFVDFLRNQFSKFLTKLRRRGKVSNRIIQLVIENSQLLEKSWQMLPGYGSHLDVFE
jgi:hypothetical protein